MPDQQYLHFIASEASAGGMQYKINTGVPLGTKNRLGYSRIQIMKVILNVIDR